MIKKIQALLSYLMHGIWQEDIESLSKKRFRGVRALRILMLIGNGFSKDQCSLHASSLTLISLLSFVPVITICFCIANMMGATELLHKETKTLVQRIVYVPMPLEDKIVSLAGNTNNSNSTNGIPVAFVDDIAVTASNGELVQEANNQLDAGLDEEEAFNANDNTPLMEDTSAGTQKEVFQELCSQGVVTIETIENLIDIFFQKVNGINFNALGIVGLVFFAWAVFGLLENIELAFNRVWKQKQQRPFLKKIRVYSSILLVVPLLCLLALLIPLVNLLLSHISRIDGGILETVLNNSFTRFIIIAALLFSAFAIVHKAVPNTKVNFKPAFCGGIFTTLASVFWFKLCLTLQIGVSKYSATFGSFAIVPIILFWVYVSWQIVLLGAEVTYAFQNWKDYKPKDANASTKD